MSSKATLIPDTFVVTEKEFLKGAIEIATHKIMYLKNIKIEHNETAFIKGEIKKV